MKAPTALLSSLGAGLLLASATPAFSAQVTFQVNMAAQVALGNFNPAADGVFVAGDPINGWSTSASPLEPSTGDANVWVGTFDVGGTAGGTGQYKFVMITGGGTTTWEGQVGQGGGTGNRTFTLSDADQTLPVVFFNNVTATTNVSADVTFQVNMSVQIALGNFDPSAGTVTLAGEFNGWSATAFELTRSTTDPNIWAGTLKLTGAKDSSVNYKFVMNGSTWEGNVGTGGAQNRALTLLATAQTLPVVFFSNLESLPGTMALTFQVNLGVLTARGEFDPDTGSVSVAGDPLNGWDAGASMLTKSTTDPTVWTGTVEIEGAAGGAVVFKYVLNGATWESTPNRSYILTSAAAQTLPEAYFNDISDLGSLAVGPVSGGQVTLSWTAGPRVRLQKATDLGGPWEDVPNTAGQSQVAVPVTGARAFFQLVGP